MLAHSRVVQTLGNATPHILFVCMIGAFWPHKSFCLTIHSHLAILDCINLRGGVRFMLASGIANLPCCPPFKFQHQRARKYLLLLIGNVNRTLKMQAICQNLMRTQQYWRKSQLLWILFVPKFTSSTSSRFSQRLGYDCIYS